MNKTEIEETLTGWSGIIHCEPCKVSVFVYNVKEKANAIRALESSYNKYHNCEFVRYEELELVAKELSSAVWAH